jgi:hypothetical protein
MAAVVKALEKASGCTINDWTIYSPLDEHPYYSVLMLENKEGKDLSGYADLAHDILVSVNPRYAYFTAIKGIGNIAIENLQHGSQEAWADMKVKNGTPVSTVKPVRILDTPEKEEFFLERVRTV